MEICRQQASFLMRRECFARCVRRASNGLKLRER